MRVWKTSTCETQIMISGAPFAGFAALLFPIGGGRAGHLPQLMKMAKAAMAANK
jgi:hypothetical protein